MVNVVQFELGEGGRGRWGEGTITKKSPKHYVVPEIHGAYAQGNRRGVQATLCAAALKERNYLVSRHPTTRIILLGDGKGKGKFSPRRVLRISTAVNQGYRVTPYSKTNSK